MRLIKELFHPITGSYPVHIMFAKCGVQTESGVIINSPCNKYKASTIMLLPGKSSKQCPLRESRKAYAYHCT